MQMDEGLDTGDMIVKTETPITSETKAVNLHDDLAQMGAELILEVLADLSKPRDKQDNEQSTYAPLLKKSDGRIDWSQTALEIDRQIRALNPWPGVWAEIQGKRFKILKAKPAEQNSTTTPCGQGTFLQIEMLQPEGKKPMDLTSAINGGYLCAEALKCHQH